MRPEKYAEHGPVGRTILIYHCPFPLLIPYSSNGLQIPQLLRWQTNPFSFEGGGHDLWRLGLWQDE